MESLNFATRLQLQTLMKLGGDRNAQRVLNRMEKDGSIKSHRREFKVYYLSNRGKERIGSNQSDLKQDKIKHTLMRNDLYIKLGMPRPWTTERPIPLGKETIIPDATYIKDGVCCFVEIDNTQTMRTNYEKIKKYAMLSSVMEQQGEKMELVWYTVSDVRKVKLEKACSGAGLEHFVLSSPLVARS